MRKHGTRDEAGHQPHCRRCENGADRTAAGAFHDVRGEYEHARVVEGQAEAVQDVN